MARLCAALTACAIMFGTSAFGQGRLPTPAINNPVITGGVASGTDLTGALVTPTGGTQTTLGAAIAGAAGCTTNCTFTGNTTISGGAVSGAVITQSPSTHGASPIYSPDAAVQAIIGWVPGNTTPGEIPTLLPGIFGAGATYYCGTSSPNTNSASVACNLVAQHQGNLNFGNGSGMLFQMLDPGGIVNSFIQYTPGQPGATIANSILFQATGRNQITSSQILFYPLSAGVGLGQSTQANGAGCVAAGSGAKCFGQGSFASGTNAYDFSSFGVRVFQGQSIGNTNGTNQLWEQTLQRNITSTTALRLTVDGGSGVSNTVSMPVQANGHGSFNIDVECTDMTSGDTAYWVVSGSFSAVVSAFRLTAKTGDASAIVASGTLATITLAVTADTTNTNFSVLVTPPAANAHTIACSAIGRWMQRIL